MGPCVQTFSAAMLHPQHGGDHQYTVAIQQCLTNLFLPICMRRAAQYGLAQEYIDAFSKLASGSNTLMLPTDAGNASSMVAQASLCSSLALTRGL